jgi:hypothetical protein
MSLAPYNIRIITFCFDENSAMSTIYEGITNTFNCFEGVQLWIYCALGVMPFSSNWCKFLGEKRW